MSGEFPVSVLSRSEEGDMRTKAFFTIHIARPLTLFYIPSEPAIEPLPIENPGKFFVAMRDARPANGYGTQLHLSSIRHEYSACGGGNT